MNQIKKMLKLALLATGLLLFQTTKSQSIGCENFNNNSTGSWLGWLADVNTSTAAPTANGTPYLRGNDHGGISYIYSMAYNANNIRCGAICFDYKVFQDGETTNPNVTGLLRIFSGTMDQPLSAAIFVLDIPVNQLSGWTNICIPMNQVTDGSPLPSNAQGHWTMPGGNTALWNALMLNFSGISLTTDVVGSTLATEVIGIDNICYAPGSCCVTNASSQFTVQTSCVNGAFGVTATPTGNTAPNHWWGLMETTTEGSTSDLTTIDANPATPALDPVQVQTGNTANFPWLDLSKYYYIKHRVWNAACSMWLETRVAIPLLHAKNLFNLEDAGGNEKSTFCYGEDIFLDGTSCEGENGYFIDVWRRQNSSQPFTWYGQLGWFNGQAGIVNITQLFAAQNPHIYFTPGYEYSVKLAISNVPNCIAWTAAEHVFEVECCDNLLNGCFKTDALSGPNGYSVIAKDFNPYPNIGAAHEWYVLSSPNAGGGPYTPVSVTTSTTQTAVTVLSNAQDGLYYFVIHKLRTACGEICTQRVLYQARAKEKSAADQEIVPDAGCTTINCCFLFDYWPNGAGESQPFTAKFAIDPDDLGNNQYLIKTIPDYTYSNNPSVTHEWYLFSSPNASGGPYLPIERKYGLNYSYSPANDGLYYFVIHKVKSPCGEVCYGQNVCRNCGDAKTSCELCTVIDCSALDTLWPYCVKPYLPHNDCEKGLLAWTDVPGSYSFDVEVSFNDPACCRSPYPPQSVIYHTENSYFDINSVPTPAYTCFRWRVVTKCFHGVPSAWTDWICYDCKRYTAGKKISVAAAGETVQPEPFIAPNPNSGTMTLYLKVSGDLTITVDVYSATGKRVQTLKQRTVPGGQFSQTLTLPPNEKGMYTVVFKTNYGVFSKKIVVQ